VSNSDCSDGVEEANNVWVRRLKLVPWSDWLEPKKKEVADDVFVVMMEPLVEKTLLDTSNEN